MSEKDAFELAQELAARYGKRDPTEGKDSQQTEKEPPSPSSYRSGQEPEARPGSRDAMTDPGSQKPAQEAQSAEIIPLPFWGEDNYSAPVSLLRSALFQPIKRGRRDYLKDETIEAWPGIEVRYTGERLDQADLDVWLQAVQLLQETGAGLGSKIEVQIKPFLRAIGRNTGKKDREWLRSAMLRMTACAVHIKAGKQGYAGSLIEKFAYNEATGRYNLQLNSDLAALYVHGWTRLEQQARLSLGPSQLAKALYSFIQTHTASSKQPLRVSHERLYRLFGAQYSQLRFFRRELRHTLAALTERSYIKYWDDDGRNTTIQK